MRGLVIAALAWLGSGQALANQACELRLRANLPIAELGDPPAVVVAARYEDTLLRMIFDTGASTTVLEGSVPGFAGLRRLTTGVANGAGGDVAVWHARNLSLGLGGLTLSLPYVAVTDPRNPLYGNRFDGLLGIDALRDYDFEFDPEAGRIRLFSQQHCAGKVVYWANEYSEIPFRRGVDRRIDVAVRIDGRALRGIIDTGSSHTVMSWPDAEDVFGLTTDSPDIQAADGRTLTSDGKLVDASRKTFQSLDLGALRVRNVSVNLLPHSASGSLPRPFEVDEASPQIVIGMDLLQHLRFYVANAEEMIYFTLVQPPA
jgi:predicted aspartyl protease